MGRMFVHTSVSADGRIADDAGALDWMTTDADFQRHINTMLQSLGAMVFGRRAFDAVSAYWPSADPADTSPTQVERMHHLPKYVMTNRPVDSNWNNSHALDMANPRVLHELKDSVHDDVAVFAGAIAATAAIDTQAVDELHLLVHPILLGRGDHLIGSLAYRQPLRLAGVDQHPSGLLIHRYTIVN